MRILVLGCGQGGTCLLTEVLRGLNIVDFSGGVEDRTFLDYPELPENYGTKLTTDATEILTIDNFWAVPQKIVDCMDKHRDLHVVFSLRHPVDMFMSQLVRGQKRADGGDTEGLSDTGTPWGALLAIYHAKVTFEQINHSFRDRLLCIKMEDLVLGPKKAVDEIAKYFKTKATKKAYEFYKYNRNQYQKKRYGNKLDTLVVNIHKNLAEFGDGYFKDKKAWIDVATLFLYPIIKEWRYEI